MEATFVLKLSDGSEIIEELISAAKEKGIDYGFLVSASGSIKDFELASSNMIEGKKKFNTIYEVDSISGKIQKSGGKYEVNVRVTVSNTGFTPLSGRMLNGKAAGSLEIGIRKIDMKKMIEA